MACIWRVSGVSPMTLPGCHNRFCLCNRGSSGVSNNRTSRPRTTRNACRPPTAPTMGLRLAMLEMRCALLREVHVVANSTLPSVPQQPEKPAAFRGAASPANDHNETRMRVIRHESQEMIPVAGHQNRLPRMRKTENGGIVSLRRQHLSQPRNGMARLRGDAPNRIRNVLVEQKDHAPASAIWWAIR